MRLWKEEDAVQDVCLRILSTHSSTFPPPLAHKSKCCNIIMYIFHLAFEAALPFPRIFHSVFFVCRTRILAAALCPLFAYEAAEALPASLTFPGRPCHVVI